MKGNALKNRALVFIAASAILFITSAAWPSAQQKVKAPDWSPWQFLLDEWIGEGGGEPGRGAGGSTFTMELQNTILVRKNLAEYPATADRPAMRHDDLMIIYQEKGSTLAAYSITKTTSSAMRQASPQTAQLGHFSARR